MVRPASWLFALSMRSDALSPWVIGAEGDGEWANLRGTTTFPNTGPPSDFYDTHIDDQSSIRGRIGYLLKPRLIVYATGGTAFASIKEHDVLAASGVFTDNSATRPVLP